MLLLETLAPLASNDFADEIEYLKLLTEADTDSLKLILIVSSCYHEKILFQQSNELDHKKMFLGAAPSDPQITFA